MSNNLRPYTMEKTHCFQKSMIRLDVGGRAFQSFRFQLNLSTFSSGLSWSQVVSGRQRESRFRVYEEAPSFRPGPRVMTRAQARGDRVVLSIAFFPLATFCPRQSLVRTQRP